MVDQHGHSGIGIQFGEPLLFLYALKDIDFLKGIVQSVNVFQFLKEDGHLEGYKGQHCNASRTVGTLTVEGDVGEELKALGGDEAGGSFFRHFRMRI